MTAETLAGPVEAEVLTVDAELEALWKAATPKGRTAAAAPVARASVANLVAVVGSAAEARAAAETIGRVVGRHPARVIVLDSEPEADPPGLSVAVRLICARAPFGERKVCCEEIKITALGYATDGLPGAAAAMYTADLPIVIWWPDPPYQRADFRRLAASADRVVVDSATLGREGLEALAHFVEPSRSTRTALGDLNWSRLTPYRQLFAQFFDAAPWRDHLERIDSVAVEATESAGLLMAGWLLSRLGEKCPASRIALNTFRPAPPDRPGLIGPVFRSIVMTCSGGDAQFAVRRSDSDMVEASATVGRESVSRVARVRLAPIEQLLGDEIGYLGRDRAFDSALEWVRITSFML